MINVNPTDKLVFDLKMLQIDFNEQKKETLRHQISDKYGVPLKNVVVNFVPIMITDDGKKISLASNIISDIQDPKFQVRLFSDFIKMNGIDDIDMADIEAIDAEVNDYVDFDSYRKCTAYRFKYVKWDNYLSYGKGNYFDFTGLNGLVLLNGQPENQCGKTTFSIDLLRFALFGKSDKAPTLSDVFNKYLPNETEVMVEAGIEIDGSDYVIRRTITRPSLKNRNKKSKCKQKVEYFRLLNGDYTLIDNYEGESINQTNNIIRDTVGSVDDYNLVISATAYTLGDLLKMGQKDKSALFSRWLGLMTLEKKEEISKMLWKERYAKKLLSNRYDKASLSNEIDELNKQIAHNDTELLSLGKKKEKSESEIERLEDERTRLLLSVSKIRDDLKNIDVSTLENAIMTKRQAIEKKRYEIDAWVKRYDAIKDITFDKEVYKRKQMDIDDINKNIDNLKSTRERLLAEYKNLSNDNKRINKLISEKICPMCGHAVEIKEQSRFIDANNEKIRACVDKGKSNNIVFDDMRRKLEQAKNDVAKMENDKDISNEKEKIALNIETVQTQIELLEKEVTDLSAKMDDIKENRESIARNNEIEIGIRNVNIKISNEKNVKENIIRDIETKKNENKSCQKNIDDRKNMIISLEEEEKLIRNWKVYHQLVGRDGITKIVLRKALPIINNEICRLLDGLCDFEVTFSVTDDGKVQIDMSRDGQTMDLGICASGFESTMSSIAIRSALCSISTVSRPNFCVMDEIVGPIGVSNYDNLRKLLERMCSNYQFILHITHVEEIWDWHNKQITVYKDGNVSKIMQAE